MDDGVSASHPTLLLHPADKLCDARHQHNSREVLFVWGESTIDNAIGDGNQREDIILKLLSCCVIKQSRLL